MTGVPPESLQKQAAAAKPKVQTLQMNLHHGHSMFSVAIPPVNLEKAYLMISYWSFPSQPFTVAFCDSPDGNGHAVAATFHDTPFKQSLIRRALEKLGLRKRDYINVIITELP